MIAETQSDTDAEVSFQRMKTQFHRRMAEAIDFSKASHLNEAELRDQVRALAGHLCERGDANLGAKDRERMVAEILNEIFSFGPLEALMRDPSISDVLVNGPDAVFVERSGIVEPTNVRFADNNHLREFIQRLVERCGRRIDEASPMVDARLPDGSRLSAVFPPLAVRSATLTIRRFHSRAMRFEDMLRGGMFTREMGQFLASAVQARLNLLLSGSSGSGKTTLLNNLSRFVPESERIVTIEEVSELQLLQPDVVALEVRPANVDGRGEVTQRDLLKQSFRLRPDRLIVGEVRGGEVFELLQAMNTGHAGSMSTIHADDTREALERLELMAALSGAALPGDVARRYISSAIQILIHVSRLPTGQRKVTRISEIVKCGDDAYRVEDIFVYRRCAVAASGEAAGSFFATGYEPVCLRRFAAMGIPLPSEMFIPHELNGDAAATTPARAMQDVPAETARRVR